MPIPWIEQYPDSFPAVEQALQEPNGLLAAGADLSIPRLLDAYSQGIFPWYEEGQPVLWWSPDPRMVLRPGTMHISRSLRKSLRQQRYSYSLDTAFADVVNHCAASRRKSSGTWITGEMQRAYVALHRAGYAHSIEVWQQDRLVGGLYGVALGKVFFGESMFSRVDNASKLALAYLTRQLQLWEFELLDCQVSNPHLQSLGAVEIPRKEFQCLLAQHVKIAGSAGKWQLQSDFLW